MNERKIQSIFEPIIGQFVWGSKQSYGSFLHLEFGNSKVELGSKHNPNIKNKFPFNEYEYRQVNIKGEYTFFISMANWKIYANKVELAHDESSRKNIEFALNFINGQILSEVIINSKEKNTELKFDLGGSIIISNENYNCEINEMWNFYTKSDKVLTFRNDSKISFEKANSEFGTEKFTEIKEDIIYINKV